MIGDSDGKESACNVGDLGSLLGLGKSPEKGWQPIQVFSPGESPWTEEPGGLQSTGWQRFGHKWVTKRKQTQQMPIKPPPVENHWFRRSPAFHFANQILGICTKYPFPKKTMFGKMPSYYEFYQGMIHSPFLSAVTHRENQWYRLSTNKLRQVMGTQKCPLSPTMEITGSGRIIIDANDDDRRVEGTGDWCRHRGFAHKIPASGKREHRALWWRPLVSKCEIRRHKTTLTSDTKCKWHH